ncbi:hypothetical protein O4H61_09745 [Roseovarius aestuarii]|nr:hypothetical protein [Roseovarius aestuarii]
MSNTAPKQRRWMKSILETSTRDLPALPFQRTQRRKSSQSATSTARLLRTA